MSFWTGKTIVIAGGSSGLGFAIATELAQSRCNIVLLARDPDRLQEAAGSLSGSNALNISTFSVDLLDEDGLSKTVQNLRNQFDQIHVWVNCVGQSIRIDFDQANLDDYRRLMNANFFSSVAGSLAALPCLKETGGSLVNIGSLSSKTAWPWISPYVTSKHALAGFANQLRLEGPENIHYLFVCPGPIASKHDGRYSDQTGNLPDKADQPGAGAPVKALEPKWLARQILQACQHRKFELVYPWKTRILFATQQISPRIGDWLVRRFCR